MRQPQARKLQVCDHCGGRFGMVTYRWWGTKFCKRTCKDAYLREAMRYYPPPIWPHASAAPGSGGWPFHSLRSMTPSR